MEEINKKELTKRKKRSLKDSGTDLTLRILAFVIAVIIWFLLSITQYPTISKTIKGIHVNFSMDGTAAEENGLDALNYEDFTVDVEIKGMNYEIGTYDTNDLVATVNLDKVTKEGTYKLDIDVKSAHPTDRCSVVSVTPATVEVDFDRITSKTMEVEVDAPNISAEDKFTLREHTASPAEITISGPQGELDKIDKAIARVSTTKKLSADESIPVNELLLYNANGTIVDTSNLEYPDASDYSVDFVIYKQKTIDLKVDITSVPQGFDKSSVPIILSNDSLSVITPNLNDKDKETKTIGSIPLSNIDPSKTFTFTVELGEGEINTAGTNTVTVSFDKTGYTTKKYVLNDDYIEFINVPEGYETKLDSLTITVVGPEKTLEELYESHISAKVDMKGITGIGQYPCNASITIEGFDNVWVLGTAQALVNAYPLEEEGEGSADESEDDSESEDSESGDSDYMW